MRRRFMGGSSVGGGDLSLFDIYGNPISRTTANCYVVSKRGTYTFPLVFGNAIKGGTTNSAAYTNNGGTYSHDFVDYNGTVITSPYIETVSGAASSVQLSIADADEVFTDISIIDGSPCRYVQFTINKVPVVGANGVISIKNSSGVIMWSWHIWVWKDDLTPVTITNATGYDYNILPVNLASTWDDGTKAHIKNWFYQWGRPTPLLGPSAYNSTSLPTQYGVLRFNQASHASNFQTGINNPNLFYKYDSDGIYNWFSSSSYYNLWDAACTSTGNSDNAVVKTVYDPCPIGFCVPNGNAFSYFSTSAIVGNFINGYYFKRNSSDGVGVFFPASGKRDAADGYLSSVGSDGLYWLSSAFDQTFAGSMTLYEGYAYSGNRSARSYAYSVRPAQEQ